MSDVSIEDDFTELSYQERQKYKSAFTSRVWWWRLWIVIGILISFTGIGLLIGVPLALAGLGRNSQYKEAIRDLKAIDEGAYEAARDEPELDDDGGSDESGDVRNPFRF